MKPIIIALAAMALAGPALAADPAQVERGHKLYNYWCGTCHGPGIGNNGVKLLPGTNALQAKYKGELPALLADRTDLSPELTKVFIRNGVSIMPFFRKTEISDPEMEDIAAYLARNLKE